MSILVPGNPRCNLMTDYLQRSQLEIGVMSDTLPTNDQIPRTDTEHMGIAMLSEQLKISDHPSSVSLRSHFPIGTTNRDKSAQHDSPTSSSAIAGLDALSLTPVSEHPSQPRRASLLRALPPPSRALPPPPCELERPTTPTPPPPPSKSPPALTPLLTDVASPSFSQPPSHGSGPPVSPSRSPVSNRLLKFKPLSALRSHGANRQATAHTAEHAEEHARYEAEIASQREVAAEAEEAAKIEKEKTMRLTMVQEEAKSNVKSNMQLFLSGKPTSEEELSVVFFTCAEACKRVGLDLATVLQEPLIEGRPPVYWAILNRPTTYGAGGRAAYDSLVFTLLERCQPLNSSTLAAVRLACMIASDNVLLQRLFRRIPELSPLSTSDAMLLAPLNESDVVDIVETRDGTGSFVAHIKMLRFRLRMRVSKCVVVQFAASERIWGLRFAVVEGSTGGRTESKWLLSLELGEHSPGAGVNADLFVDGSTSDPLESGDFEGPLLAISFGSTTSELRPGHENAISVRLDDGPMGPHLLNESSALVDAKGTLYAELNVKLVRPALPTVVPDTPTKTSPPRSPDKPVSQASYPSSGKAKAKKLPKDPTEKVYTSLRRGGR